MPKTRVQELANDLGVDSKEIINYLAGLGADVKSQTSLVDERYADLARKRFAPATSIPAVQAVQPRPVGMPPRSRRTPGPGRPGAQAPKVAPPAAASASPASPPAPVADAAQLQKEQAVVQPKPLAETVAGKVDKAPAPEAKKPATMATESTPQPTKPAQLPAAANAPAQPQAAAATSGQNPVPRPQSARQPQQKVAEQGKPAPAAKPATGAKPSADKPQDRPTDGSRTQGARPAGSNRSQQGARPGDGNRPQHGARPTQSGKPATGGYQKPAGGAAPRNRDLDESEEENSANRRGNRSGARRQGAQGGFSQGAGEGKPSGGRPGGRTGAAGKPGAKAGGKPGNKPALGAKPGTGRPGARPAAKRPAAQTHPKPAPPPPEDLGPKLLTISDTISVADLAEQLQMPATTVIKTLMAEGVMAAINHVIEYDVAAMVAEKLGALVERSTVEKDKLVNTAVDTEAQLQTRPPVVTILGHVDHGKTTLLDAIRETRVVESEAGGITQHIGAYQVDKNDRMITFLDTPGHEAFTEMRSRGAQVTDIAVLVVAADDGVMPQTIEALNHAKAAQVPIIVAINKIDRPGANPDRVKQQLADHGLLAEDWGGDAVMVEVSALKKTGIEELLEMILLVADMRELRANPDRPGSGTVVEAELDKNRGPVATVLVQNGTLRTGDPIVAGSVAGRIRAMFDYTGKHVKTAGPSVPVVVLGLEEVPAAGDLVEAMEDERSARALAEERAGQKKADAQKAGRLRLSELYAKIQKGEVKDLNIVLKADVQGSVEALSASLEKLSDDKVRVNVIHGGTGGITESDVVFAATSNAIIIGFNVRPDPVTRRSAEREGVDIRLYRIIYEAIDDVKAAMSGLLEPTFEEAVLGRAEVRATFRVPNVGVIAGCYVTDGKILRNASVRVLRDSVVIFEGKIASLKRFKDDAREVAEGYECGIGIERYNDIKEGDVIEAFQMQEVKAKA